MSDRRDKFVVLIERGESAGVIPMTDEDEETCRFSSRQAARDAAVGAMWEHAWVWWIVELEEDGDVYLGMDVVPSNAPSRRRSP